MARSATADDAPRRGASDGAGLRVDHRTPERFPCGKRVGSYVGLVREEDSSAGHQRLGHITKQGSSLLRFLLVEVAQADAPRNHKIQIF